MEEARSRIQGAMENALKTLGLPQAFALAQAPPGKGDLAAPMFLVAKEAKRPPVELAKDVAKRVAQLAEEPPLQGVVAKVEAAGPYVNFYVDDRFLAEATLGSVLGRRDLYGWLCPRPEKVTLEHTSANPTGPLHVGRGRNPIIGDTLARLFRMGGYEVETQYWVNDMGRQAAILHYGMTRLPRDKAAPDPDASTKPDHVHVTDYQKANKLLEEDEAVLSQVQAFLKAMETGDRELTDDVMASADKVLDGIKRTLDTMNIKVDRFVRESDTLFDGSAAKVVETLKASKFCKEEEGSYYIDLDDYHASLGDKVEKATGAKTQSGDDGEAKERKSNRLIFTRKDGTTLYVTRDLAYHLHKLEDCDIAINVLGEDHKLEGRLLGDALRIVGAPHIPEIVFYSFVGLPAGERMSTRKGTVVYVDDLLEEAVTRAEKVVRDKAVERGETPLDKDVAAIARAVAVGAVRYNIVRVQAEKNIVFCWDEALSFDGRSAPFVQYAHTRCCGILRNAAEATGRSDWGMACEEGLWHLDTTCIKEVGELALVRELARLPNVVYSCVTNRAGHLMASYAHEVATAFNQFYRDVPVLKAGDPKVVASRLALVDATRIVLRNALWSIGVDAPERM